MRNSILIATIVLLLPFSAAAKRRPHVPDSLQVMTIDVCGIPVTMQRVEGGSFVMGATSEQYDPDLYTDKPAHIVFLSPFYIARTEVTNRLWRAVMPERVSIAPKGYPEHPVSYVSWQDCQEFVRRLDSITGLPFRLPTEAEWEYAARGGQKSRHYRFAGDYRADSVGWLYPLAGQWTHPVATKYPNELRLYDMTGNVAEWCQDLYGPYQLTTAPDPCGADTGSYRIVRGGSYDACVANSHLSVRQWYVPETAVGYIGFRVAFTLPGDPIVQPEPETAPLTQTVTIKGRKLRFSLVPAAEPYYISEEVTVALWRKVNDEEPPAQAQSLAIGMNTTQRTRFAEDCSRLCQRSLAVASVAAADTAVHYGVIADNKALTPKKKQDTTVRDVQRKRRNNKHWSALAEMVGVRLKQPDDPVLTQFQADENNNRPLRLILR